MSNAVEELLFAVLEKPSAAERSAFLDSACTGDAELRRQVEKLLKAHADVGDFLQKPVVAELALAENSSDGTLALDGSTNHDGAKLMRTHVEGARDDDDSALDFLQPSTRPDSLGRIGHYEVLQVLGKGGFGIVYRAFDDTLQRVVAVKVMAPLLAATSPARKRFLREAQTSAQVRHENVVQVHEVGESPLPFLVMEFIPGETLQQRLDRIGPVEPAEVVRIGRQIAEGLAAAHATDLIHRDIKPGNILLEGAQLKVKITDFGLARAADDASLSHSGIIAGTPNYMSPEQAKGEKIDQRADLFSLGSVLYQMASGRPPFRANSTVAILKRVADDTPRDIREIIPETPLWLCDIIAKLHAKNPAERFQSAREVADLLADCEAQLKAHAKLKDFSRIPRRTPAPSGRHKWVAVTVVLVVLLPLFALAATEWAGVTQLLQWRPTPDAGPVVGAKKEQPEPPPVKKKTPPAPAKPEPNPKKEAKDPVAAANLDPDRRAAEYVRSVRGSVKINGQNQELALTTELPRESFRLTGVVFWNGDGTQVTVTDDGLSVFKDCNNVIEIMIFRTKIGAAGLANFKGCSNLAAIGMDQSEVTDEGLAAFKACKNLKILRVTHSEVTDAGLANLKSCTSLTRLELIRTQVSDAGLDHLKDRTNLTSLELTGTRVTDTGLVHLTGLTALARLDLRGTKVTANGVAGLAKVIPKCRIEWDGGVIPPR